MEKIYVAFIWHYHQPYYRKTIGGNFMLPWVRLHGIKDYNGMINILKEFPAIKATFNFTPVLIKQIEEYCTEKAIDEDLEIARKKISDLTIEDRIYILDNFFRANKYNMIKPFPRYWELLKKRKIGEKKGVETVNDFTDSELLDLIVLFNLSWIHQTEFQHSEFLMKLKKKGRNFTEKEKDELLEFELKILTKIFPLYTEISNNKQIEIITSPFYHPILPLLCNFESAKPGLPGVNLPREKSVLKDDAKLQIKKGIEYFKKIFGSAPDGMWPSEGSVSEDIIPLLIEENIKWIATDEEILSKSINVPFRDEKGAIINKSVLYKPYKIVSEKGELTIVFRDRELSDIIGFDYHRMKQEDAAVDLIKRLESRIDPSNDKQLVTIILDGENAWESFSENGILFFRTLYELLSKNPRIKTTTISEYLNKYPPDSKIEKLYPGSWINANFRIWIGHEEDLKGWEYLLKTRKDLFRFLEENKNLIPEEQKEKLMDELFIAEGSDWYWWFGDDHFSGMDDKYDQLFRQHLKNIYYIMGKIPPDFLEVPVMKYEEKAFFSLPRAFLRVKIDGKISSYYEWFDAGYFSTKTEGGSMESSKKRIFDSMYFGFDGKYLYLRIDFLENFSLEKEKEKILIHFYSPIKQSLSLFYSGNNELVEIVKNDNKKISETARFCIDKVLEMKIAFEELELKPKDMVLFSVYFEENGNMKDKIPLTRSIFFEVPDKYFEIINWRV
ncbi:hypothetical protein DRQ09_04350 [candidate division KSB1 bacterium]|nr:MAG: hypothetical protein DRQ09_04350 [candidate division KSB1 bacterium]